MSVPPIPTKHLTALLGGHALPARKEPPVENPSIWHLLAELFFVAVGALVLWALARTLEEAP